MNPDRLRCPQCRTRRTDPHLMVLHVLQCKRPLCQCEGVPFSPHRPGTQGCDHHPMAGLHRAERHGATPAELLEIERRIRQHIADQTCPF